MAADVAYYLKAYRDFIDLDLPELAVKVLQEGIAANPSDAELKHLAAKSTDALAPPLGALPPETEGLPEMDGKQFWAEVQSHGLDRLLRQHGGLLRVLDVLPLEQAEAALRALQSLPSSEWRESSSETVHYEGTRGATHLYSSYMGDKVNDVQQSLKSLAPEYFAGFQAAKYERSGHISPHDDSSMFTIPSYHENRSQRFPGGTVVCRKIAIICYLTKDWRPEYGGGLADLHIEDSPRTMIPRFNSLVAFLVPRVHEVQALAPGCPPRFSVFGWFSDDLPYKPPFGPENSTMDERLRRAGLA